MNSYIEAVRHVYRHGEDVFNERTGSMIRTCSGLTIRHDSSESFPIPSARRVSLRIAFEEIMFFARGRTDTKILEKKKIGIWKGNTSREFLDAKGLYHLPEGDMGKGYGYQWRNFFGTDQLSRLFTNLLLDPSSRQHLVVAWNPAELHLMALPPCHFSFQVLIKNNRLDLIAYLRSNDLPYGTPYNLMGYGFIQSVLVNYMNANGFNIKAGELILQIGDAHMYQNQYEGENAFVYSMIERYMEVQLKKEMNAPKPVLKINKEIKTFQDFLDLEFSDLTLENYDPQPDYKNKPNMVA